MCKNIWWYGIFIFLFRGLLHKEPGFRLGCRRVGKPEEGAEELKSHPFFSQGDVNTGREPIPWKKMEVGKVYNGRFSKETSK